LRTKIREIRRRDLERAAFEVLKTHGFSGTTVAKVAQVADMSPGIVHFYYKNKEELLEATVRYLNRPMHKAVIANLRAAKTPRDRFVAIIEGEIAEEIFNPDAARVWVSFFGQCFFVERYARIQRIFHKRLASNLMYTLRPIMNEADAKRLTLELSVLVDAVWMRMSVGYSDYTRGDAFRQIMAHYDCCVGTANSPAVDVQESEAQA